MTVLFSAFIAAVLFGLGALVLTLKGHRWALYVYCVLLGAGATVAGVPGVSDLAEFLAKAPLKVEGWFN